MLTLATGAAGWNWSSLYAGIRGLLRHIHREIGRTLWFRQARAPHVYSWHPFDAANGLSRNGMDTTSLGDTPQALPEPVDLTQALLDRLHSSRGMFRMVLDRSLQVVDRCCDGPRLLSKVERAELLRVAFMPPTHWATSSRNLAHSYVPEAIGSPPANGTDCCCTASSIPQHRNSDNGSYRLPSRCGAS